MPPTNEFLPFCATDTGSNLLTESEYAASSDRTSGNKPGVASAKLNNKAIRQANAMASQIAQLVSDKTGTDVLDDALYTKLLAQLNATLTPFTPQITPYTTGSGNHNLTYIFAIASGSATIGATYTHNAVTYTVKSTIASGLFLRASGSAAPLASGTLTKTGGTGDSSITFYAVRVPLYLVSTLVGGGGGGGGGNSTPSGNGGSGGGGGGGCSILVVNSPTGAYAYGVGTGGAGGANTGTDGTAGNDSTFGVATAGGGARGNASAGVSAPGIGGAGGTGSGGTRNLEGSDGAYGVQGISGVSAGTAGVGGNSFLGGGGRGGANSGAAGAGGNNYGGGGGGGSQGGAGGTGANGYIEVEEHYQ